MILIYIDWPIINDEHQTQDDINTQIIWKQITYTYNKKVM